MIHALAAAQHPGRFREDEPVVQGRALEPPAHLPGARVPLFGQRDCWDFNGVLRRPANRAASEWNLKFATGLCDPAWNLLAREASMIAANPGHEAVLDAGVHLGIRGEEVGTLRRRLTILRQLCVWAQEQQMPRDFARWSPADLRRFVAHTRENGRHGDEALVGLVAVLKTMAALAPALSQPWPAEDPWPGKSARQVMKMARTTQLATPAIVPEIWFPLIRAAWAYIHTFSPEIFRAERRYQQLLAAARPSIAGKQAEFDAWITDPANSIPLFPGPTPVGAEPDVHWGMITLLLGIVPRRSSHMFAPGDRRTAPNRRRVLDAVEAGRITYHPLLDDPLQVTRPDGSTGPWHPGVHPRDLVVLRLILRNAAYVLVGGLSMMRDGELQEIVRGSVVEYYNSPAIASTLRKANADQPRKHWWIAEPVAEAITVAEAVSVHPERIFAPMKRVYRDQAAGAGDMIESFIEHANAGRAWSGLDEIPPGPVRPHMFRKTMAMLTDQFAGSEIALGQQLKHVATRALANTVTRGYAAADASWARHLTGGLDAARFRRLTELYGQHKDGDPIGYGPGADRVKTAFDQITAAVKARGGDARTEADLLRKARITIRFGTLNNCLYDGTNPAGAACLENAVIPEGHTGPLDERCRPDRCANSMIGIEHVAIHDSHRRTQLKLLQQPGLPACRKALITRELERVEAVLDKAGQVQP